jgi:hypothetical protein
MRLLNAVSTLRGASLVTFVVIFGIACLRGPAPTFLYDASVYWNGAVAMVSGGDVIDNAGLTFRGALTPLIYSPAAFGSEVLHIASSGMMVLVQNALLLAFLGAVLLPRLLAKITPLDFRHIFVVGAVVAALLAGYAPYPLMDLWSTSAMLLGIVLLTSNSRLVLVIAGFAFAVAGNLRPACLVAIAVAAVIWLIGRWRSAVWPALGLVAGVVPQILLNHFGMGRWLLLPTEAYGISNVQTAFAGFVTRYDTLAYVGAVDPRQFYCSTEMASVLISGVPRSPSELLFTFLSHPLQSVPFLLEKLSASLAWGWTTPYGDVPGGWIGPFAIVTISLTIGGLAVFLATVLKGLRKTSSTATQLLALAASTALTVLFSTPESRFSLPLVIVATLGLPFAFSPPHEQRGRPGWSRQIVACGICAIAIVGTILLAGSGLAHPAPPGAVSPATCRT